MNATQTVLAVQQALCAALGSEHVRDVADIGVDQVPPSFVVEPRTEEEIAAVMKIAAANDMVVAPAGCMTHQDVGNTPRRIDILLDLHRLNSVLYYDPGDLTIGIEAGVRIGELEGTLAPNWQLLPLDVPSAGRTSVGGALATGLHGPLKHAFGGPRDFCVGIRFVTADGVIAKAGGRVVKNVAGYDLMKLLIGSFGTLAVITSANFKLFPRPRQTRAFVAEFASVKEALRYRDAILQSPLQPIALELVSPLAESHLHAMIHGGRWQIIVRAAGSDPVMRRFRVELGDAVCSELGGEEETKLWKSIADFPETAVASHPESMLLQVNAPMRDLAATMDAANSIAVDNGFFLAAVGRAVGSMWLAFVPVGERGMQPQRYAATVRTFREELASAATAVVWRCPTAVKSLIDVWGPTSTSLKAMGVVKKALDAGDILNRGRFLL